MTGLYKPLIIERYPFRAVRALCAIACGTTDRRDR